MRTAIIFCERKLSQELKYANLVVMYPFSLIIGDPRQKMLLIADFYNDGLRVWKCVVNPDPDAALLCSSSD